MVLESSVRSLTSAERRFVRAKVRELESRARRAPKVLIAGAGVVAVLWVLTLLASDAPWPVVTVFWLAVGGGILFWVARDLRKDAGALPEAYKSVQRRNEARVFTIRATAFAEFEEVEDEGACYAFEIDGGRLVFVVGQQYYPEAKFPSLDFSIVDLLDERGTPVDMVIEKRGPKATADRTIPAATKLALEIPEDLEVIPGRLSQIEDLLGNQ